MAATLALQLYSLRDEIVHDYRGIVEKVAAAGYAGVEPAGFPGSSLAEAVAIYRDNGLTVCSSHGAVPVGDDEQQVIENAQAMGTTRLVSGRGPDDFAAVDKIRESCDIFNQAAGNAATHGMTFSIHNHWWEFTTLDGTPVYKIMLEHLDPAVLFQIDTYWVKTGGIDPASVVEELGARAPLLHIKDGPCVKGEPMTAVGRGTMDFAAIHAVSGHAEWYIVELDTCATDMVDAVTDSAAWLLEGGYAHGR